MAIEPTILLSARGISKQFAGIEVLSNVDLDLMTGEIHALLGENGAGKSTFAKIIAGVHRPTRGSLTLNGAAVDIANPIVAQKLGTQFSQYAETPEDLIDYIKTMSK